jgi:hypothetical protein
MVSVHRASVSDERFDQLQEFYRRFLSEHRKALKDAGVPLRATLFGRHHDAIIAITSSSLVVVAAKGTSTDGSSTDRYLGFSSQPEVTRTELMRSAAREFGWQDMASLEFSLGLLEAAEDQQRDEARRVSEIMVDQMRGKQKVAKALGVTEALTYLDNARSRFEAGGASGFSDCKANCRNAILSLVRGLTGTDNLRNGVKKLDKEGLLGGREAEVVKAIEDLVAKLHGLASKTGTHPPMATEEDARFALALAEATVQYLVRTVAKAKGL